MRILVLDDEKVRHDTFASRLAGHDVTHVWSAKAAAKALDRERFDLVFLDHDLGESAGNGQQVADYIARRLDPEKRSGRVIVHSWNVVRAPLMVATLCGAGIPARHVIFPGAADEVSRPAFEAAG